MAARNRRRPRKALPRSPLVRWLRIEPLEDRRLLAGVVVGNALDVVNGNTTTIANLIGDDGGDGISLREAIQAANATAGADGITFAAALSGALITLGGTELAISEALTIDARPLAANVTIDGISTSRIFNITTTTGDFTLGGLVLTRGRTTLSGSVGWGGAIRSLTRGSLTLNESTVSENRTVGSTAYGGGIFAYGAVTLTRSTVIGNSTTGQDADGGGIWNFGPATFNQSTLSGNSTAGSSAAGGGIWNYGSVTLNHSTVSGNSTAGSSSYGGGIFALLSSVTLTNSTVSGNSTTGPDADGGGIFGGGAVTITQSTVTQNQTLHASALGHGVFQTNGPFNFPFSIVGSIFAGNITGGGVELAQDPNSTLTVNYSLVGTGIALDPDSSGNNVVTNAPQLYPLAGNGGPTQTHMLPGGSQAINAGDPAAVSPGSDQRGAPFTRVYGGRIDVGAYERQTVAGLSLVVDTLTDVIDGVYTMGELSLREALDLANGSLGANTVSFSAALTSGGPAAIFLTQGELAIRDSATINGPGANLLTIDQNASGDGVLNIDDLNSATIADVGISGLTITGASPFNFKLGGGIRSEENLTINASVISGNFSADRGGGIYQRGGNLTINASTISGNESDKDGGGIYIGSGALTINDSTITNNSSFQYGGGINSHGIATIFRSTISDNDADRGGGIHSNGVTVTDSTISGNSTQYSGGGIHAGTATITGSTISGNYSDQGGGILAGTATITGSTISGNRASRGGGIYSASLTLTSSTISGNVSFHSGGGLYLINGNATVSLTTISGNSSHGVGGGVTRDGSGGQFIVSHSTISGNVADVDADGEGQGGGIYSPSFSPSLRHTILAGNIRGWLVTRDDLSGFASATYSLIGDQTGTSLVEAPVGSPDGNGNLIGGPANGPIIPMLSPLSNNGGPTMTHAPLAGSPAIDAGNPSIVFNPAEYDQRGAPFARVAGGRIDMGAYEVQPLPTLVGDYNGDGVVNAADYVVWRDTVGSTTDLRANGDNSNNAIDAADYGVWKANFGETPGAGARGEEQGASHVGESAAADSQLSTIGHVGASLRDTNSGSAAADSPTWEQARMLALLDLLDSLPAREEDAEFDVWGTERASSDEAQRDAAFAGLVADPIESVSMSWP